MEKGENGKDFSAYIFVCQENLSLLFVYKAGLINEPFRSSDHRMKYLKPNKYTKNTFSIRVVHE